MMLNLWAHHTRIDRHTHGHRDIEASARTNTLHLRSTKHHKIPPTNWFDQIKWIYVSVDFHKLNVYFSYLFCWTVGDLSTFGFSSFSFFFFGIFEIRTQTSTTTHEEKTDQRFNWCVLFRFVPCQLKLHAEVLPLLTALKPEQIITNHNHSRSHSHSFTFTRYHVKLAKRFKLF